MDDKILVAIVAASAAILGGIIQKAFDLISNWQKTKQERSKGLQNIQKEVYWDFFLALQKLMNNKTNEKLLQNSRKV